VFIKHRADKDLAPQVGQIKALVVNSVEGLAYDNVTVALFPAESMPGDSPATPAAPAESPQVRQAALVLPLMAGGVAGALALGGGGLLWWRRRSPVALPAPTVAPALAAPPRKAPTTDAQAAFRSTISRVAGRS
jgi:type III secretion protein J